MPSLIKMRHFIRDFLDEKLYRPLVQNSLRPRGCPRQLPRLTCAPQSSPWNPRRCEPGQMFINIMAK